MKYFTSFIVIVFLSVLLINSIYAEVNPKKKAETSQNTISTLLDGLKTENLGLKTGCAYMLGELQITEAIIPLMKILRNDKNEEARIAAALALYKIGTPLSINAVRQSIIYDESARVSKLCVNFYNEYQRNKISDEDKTEVGSIVAVK